MAVSPLPIKINAPGLAFNIKEKSSAPITGATDASTLALPAIPCATLTALSVSVSVLISNRIVALIVKCGLAAHSDSTVLNHLAEALFNQVLNLFR